MLENAGMMTNKEAVKKQIVRFTMITHAALSSTPLHIQGPLSVRTRLKPSLVDVGFTTGLEAARMGAPVPSCIFNAPCAGSILTVIILGAHSFILQIFRWPNALGNHQMQIRLQNQQEWTNQW